MVESKPTLHIYRGIPASGKTHAAMERLNVGDGITRVNRDDIRFQAFGKYWGVDEDHVTALEHMAVRTGLKRGFDVINDATNLRARNVRGLLKIAFECGAEVQYRDFPVPLELALGRDAHREKSVGSAVVTDFYNRYTRNGKLPAPPEAFAPLVFRPYVRTYGLPSSIIVDIDGTLAHIPEGGRSPYDGTRVHEDIFDETVASVVARYREWGGYVILMSGRKEEYREVTEKWLGHHRFDYDGLYMRADGDERNDAIVKDELFEKHIAGNFNVDFVLDDRNRVVDMWRAKGLKCLQVAEGNF